MKGWVENPYWQHFCGEVMFQHHFPINPSQMTRWRKRIGEKGVEKLLQATIDAGKATGTITEQSFEKVIVDTTVQPKAVQHPTDARLYRKVHAAMLRIAGAEGIKLRQSYRKLMEWGIRKHGGYAKAKQFKRARKVLRNLKSMAGRVMRDVERKIDDAAFQKHKGTLILSELILTQKRSTKGKVYSLHAPEVECIAKGKAHKPYEFGVKASLAVTHKEGFRFLPGAEPRGAGAKQQAPCASHTRLGGGRALCAASIKRHTSCAAPRAPSPSTGTPVA